MQKEIQYKEGEKINFIIKKHIELSEGDWYYVLEDREGRKHLLKSVFYKKYNFKIEDEIICKVDHVNCSGKIFLEPLHPFYAEGEIYNFKIINIENTKNRLGKQVLLIELIDKLKNKAICKTENHSSSILKNENYLKCKVELIKKGRLYLSLVNQGIKKHFKLNKYYNFKIVDIKNLSDTFKYYILKDSFHNTHILRHEYYENHKIIIGETIKCRIVKYSSTGYYILEPKHPFYEIDKEYDFIFVKQEKELFFKFTDNFKVTVKDIFGNDIKFLTNVNLLINKNIKKIKCAVLEIKKGKPAIQLAKKQPKTF